MACELLLLGREPDGLPLLLIEEPEATNQIRDTPRSKRRASAHRVIVDRLKEDSESASVYRRLLRALLIDGAPLDAEGWKERQTDILNVALGLCEGPTSTEKATVFVKRERHNAFTKTQSLEHVATLQSRGWRVADILDGATLLRHEQCLDSRGQEDPTYHFAPPPASRSTALWSMS